MFEQLIYNNWKAVLGFLSLVLLFSIYRINTSPAAQVPGPWHTKYTRAAYTYHWLKGDSPHYIHSLHAQYGPTVRYGPGQICTRDLDSVKTIYTIKETFLKSSWYRNFTASNLHTIFNTSNVDVHRRYRRLLASPLSETSLKATIPEIESRVKMAIGGMQEEMTARGATDVYKWFFFMATDTIGELAFGDSFRMLELGKINEYANDVQKVASSASLRVAFPTLVRTLGQARLPPFNDVRKRAERVKNYAVTSIKRYQNFCTTDSEKASKSVFSRMFQANEDEKMTFDEITVNAQSLIVAGSDTTSNTLTYLTWEVCRRPEIKKRLLEELQTLPVDYEESHLRQLPFLESVINETLRLHSIAGAILPRVVPPEGADIGGYWLDGGTVVGAQAYTMHRNEDTFPDADKFLPSRWEDTTKRMKDSFMPFGRGSRNCIGMHLALIEIRLAAAAFFLKFPNARMSSTEGMSDGDMVPTTYFLQSPSGGRCLIQGQ